MINYEKLKIAHELLIKSGLVATIKQNFGREVLGQPFRSLILWHKGCSIEFSNFEQLYEKIIELSNTKPPSYYHCSHCIEETVIGDFVCPCCGKQGDDSIQPKFEGEVNGFNKCDHEGDGKNYPFGIRCNYQKID